MNIAYAKTIALIEIFVKKAEEATRIEQFQPQIPEQKESHEEYEEPDDEERMAVIEAISNNNFDLEFLRSLQDDDNISFYVESVLKPVASGKDAGLGSGRRVYYLGDDRVLKHAYNNSGIYQNYEEARIANRNPAFADVFDLGPNARWIVSEMVEGFSSPEEFQIRTGVPVEAMQKSVKIKNLDSDMISHLRSRYDLEDDAVEFIKNLHKINKDFGTIFGDILNYKHWGVAPDGSVKLYDYGLDSRGYSKMYNEMGLYVGEDGGPNTEDEANLNRMLDELEKAQQQSTRIN